MIFELIIKDFILIKHETIAFKEGLNIITGETGAGKSMILGAIDLVLGAAANREMIRLGADQASVQCSFFTNEAANAVVDAAGITVDPDVLTISREINAKGKSISRINGQIVTLNIIKSVSEHLLDIHGQFDNQALFNKSFQLACVDAFGGETVAHKTAALGVIYEALHNEMLLRDKLEAENEDKSRQVDFLSFQLEEIENVSPKPEEDHQIESEFSYYSNLEQIVSGFDMAQAAFDGEYGEGILPILSKLTNAFKKFEGYDEGVKRYSKRLEEQYYLLEDLARDMNHFSETLSADPEKLNALELRMDAINRLKTKYGKTVSEILAHKEAVSSKLAYYEAIDDVLQVHDQNITKYIAEYDTLATELTTLRHAAAVEFKAAITKELESLNMKSAVLDIAFGAERKRTALGVDDIEFTISTNPGQPFKPLKRVLSGGELSRLMLSVKIVLGQKAFDVSQIFDEIDAGISGITANVVGEKLHRLARGGQIICITHLPQIAVFADHHFRIRKGANAGSAFTEVRQVQGDGILEEIGRLVGGVELTANTATHVQEMLTYAAQKKAAHI